MSQKPSSQKRTQRQQEERTALNNVFTTFLVGLAAECYLFIVYRSYQNTFVLDWHRALTIVMWAALAVMACGAVLALWKRKNEKLFRIGAIAAGAGAFLAATGWVMTTFLDGGVIAMCAAVPILTILMLIFFLYQRDCFLNTILMAGTLFTIWVCDRGLDGSWRMYIMICAIAVAVLVAVLFILARKMQTNGGKLGKLQLLPADGDYRMIYIMCAVSILLIALALVFPGYIYYLIWAAVIALFAELAYYTAKLM